MCIKLKWFCIAAIVIAIVYLLGSRLYKLDNRSINEEDIDGPTFGTTFNGKPGINLTGEGVGIHMDMDGEIGLGFGF